MDGVALERTALAWTRTAFAFMLNGALILRVAWERVGWVRSVAVVAAVAALVFGALLWWLGPRLYAGALGRFQRGERIAREGVHRLLATAVAMLA